MHNIISFKKLVALFKFAPLHLNQIWDRYESWSVRFNSNSQFRSKEVFRTPYGQVRRQHQELVSVSLEPAARSYVWTTYGFKGLRELTDITTATAHGKETFQPRFSLCASAFRKILKDNSELISLVSLSK